MESFTEFIQKWRKDNSLTIPDDVAAELAEFLARRLKSELRRRMSRRGTHFGQESPADISQTAMQALFEGKLTRSFARVESSKDLYLLLLDECWSRLCKKWKRPKHRFIRGFSAAAKQYVADDNVVAAMQNQIGDQYKGYFLDVAEQGIECKESLALALKDAKKWIGRKWVLAFIAQLTEGATVSEIAKESGRAPGTVTRNFDKIEFCIDRRIGKSPRQMIKKLGQEQFDEWTKSLDLALIKSHRPEA